MKKKIGGLSREINMEVVGELECKNKEVVFYTFNSEKPSEVFTVGGGEVVLGD